MWCIGASYRARSTTDASVTLETVNTDLELSVQRSYVHNTNASTSVYAQNMFS